MGHLSAHVRRPDPLVLHHQPMMIVLFLLGWWRHHACTAPGHQPVQSAETAEEAQEESGWKLVHGDVFRAPGAFGTLSVFVGTGFQLVGMMCVTLVFAVLGFLSPANRGGLMTAMLMLYVIMGIVNGYVSARLYKMFKGTDWKLNTVKAAFLFPSVVFTVFCILNSFIWGQKSPRFRHLLCSFLWFGISVHWCSWVVRKRQSSIRCAPTRFRQISATVVHKTLRHTCWRHPPLRRHLHRAFLHSNVNVAASVLLHLRLRLCVSDPVIYMPRLQLCSATPRSEDYHCGGGRSSPAVRARSISSPMAHTITIKLR